MAEEVAECQVLPELDSRVLGNDAFATRQIHQIAVPGISSRHFQPAGANDLLEEVLYPVVEIVQQRGGSRSFQRGKRWQRLDCRKPTEDPFEVGKLNFDAPTEFRHKRGSPQNEPFG